MTMPALYQAFAAYNQAMNRRIYELCADIPDMKRRTDYGAFFKSVHGTLNHLLFGDRAWMNRFDGGNRQLAAPSTNLFEGFIELRQARERMDEEMISWCSGLTQQWLNHEIEWHSTTDDITRRHPRWFLVSHMFNHQTHHRGQLTTLLTQMGHDVGVTDLARLP